MAQDELHSQADQSDPGTEPARSLEQYKEKCELYESWLRAIDEHAKFDVWFKDAESRYQFVNQHFERSIGRSRAELINKHPDEVFGGKRAERVVAMDKKVMVESRLERVVPCDESGCLEMHEEHRFAVRDSRGAPIGLGCFAFETTEQSMTEEALSQAQKLAELGNWRWAVKDDCLISCSEQFAKILGVELTEAFELMHDRLNRLVHPDDTEMVRQLHAQLSNPDFGGYEIEYQIVLSNGEQRYVREIAEPMLGNNGLPVEYAGTLQDITRQKRTELELLQAKQELETRVERRTQELQYLAHRDPLTGLLNRTHFRDLVQRRFDACDTDVAVILLDLDGFKAVNDSHGHSVGDDLLRAIAGRISDIAGDHALIARLGGDEFGVAIGCSADARREAVKLCREFRKIFDSRIDIGSLTFFLGCSFGISILGSDDNGLEEVLKFADIALYRAKDSNDGIVVFERKMAEEAAFTKRLEEDLRAAVSAGTLQVAYQPQVLTKCESLIGVEALARWHHPQFGEISPVTFIKIAEDCGLINQLGELILDRACEEMSALMSDLGRDIRLSVNISTKQFYEGCIAAKIAQALEKWNVDPELLEIEVTETVFIRNMEETRVLLDAIRDMGVRIALDDFGTGYSSLSYLRQFEVDRIKLDREFIKDICWSKYDNQVLQGILKLAQSLEIKTIAEGVEDVQQRDILERYGCDEIQGYFYGRPLSIDRLRLMIEHRWPDPDTQVEPRQTVSAA